MAGLADLNFLVPISLFVMAALVILVVSYRQTIFAVSPTSRGCRRSRPETAPAPTAGRRGDRLVFSNGIIALSVAAGGFGGEVDAFVPLLAAGLFTAFYLCPKSDGHAPPPPA